MHWYALSTKPHQENQARQNLQGVGVQAFCPLLKRRKLIRRRMQTVVGPLFPGYLFARFDLVASYRKVKFASGVRKIVSFGSAPEPVSQDIIDAITERLQDGHLTVPRQSLVVGQPVRIEAGPLRGLEAIFEREMGDQQRVVLLLRTLASQWRVVMPVEQLANQ